MSISALSASSGYQSSPISHCSASSSSSNIQREENLFDDKFANNAADDNLFSEGAASLAYQSESAGNLAYSEEGAGSLATGRLLDLQFC